ncbi:MAG: hypothetical protein ACRD2L_07365, partial [Terriglobia bacterium]
MTVEKTFTDFHLKKWIYPGLSWYFAAWTALTIGVGIWRRPKLIPGAYVDILPWGVLFESPEGQHSLLMIWAWTYFFGLLAAFVGAGISRLNLRLFQLFLPALFVLFLASFWAEFDVYMSAAVPPGLSESQVEA